MAEGHIVHATAPEDDKTVKARLKDIGVSYHPITMRRAGFSLLADWSYHRSLCSLMCELRVDGVFAYTHKAVIYGLRAASASGVSRRVAMITGLGYAFTSGGGIQRRLARIAVACLYRSALRHATNLYFQNPDDIACFKDMGLLRDAPDPRIVGGSGVSLHDFPATPLPQSPPVYLMLSRLIVDKGVREYAAAAAIVKQQYPSARFLLAGNLDENPSSIKLHELEQWVQSGAIEYLGEVSNVAEVLKACSIYVLPSYREGTPRSVLEALATGRPIITTDVPGCRETVLNPGHILEDGSRRCENGWLVPAANVDSLARAMIDLANPLADLKALGAASRRHAELKYDVNMVNFELTSAFKKND